MDPSFVSLAYRCALDAYDSHPTLRKAVQLVGAETVSDHELPGHVEGLRKEANELRQLVAAMGCAGDLKSAMETAVTNQRVTIEGLRLENERLRADNIRLVAEMEQRVSAERTANSILLAENEVLSRDVKSARRARRWGSLFSKLTLKRAAESAERKRAAALAFATRTAQARRRSVIAWGRLAYRLGLHRTFAQEMEEYSSASDYATLLMSTTATCIRGSLDLANDFILTKESESKLANVIRSLSMDLRDVMDRHNELVKEVQQCQEIDDVQMVLLDHPIIKFNAISSPSSITTSSIGERFDLFVPESSPHHGCAGPLQGFDAMDVLEKKPGILCNMYTLIQLATGFNDKLDYYGDVEKHGKALQMIEIYVKRVFRTAVIDRLVKGMDDLMCVTNENSVEVAEAALFTILNHMLLDNSTSVGASIESGCGIRLYYSIGDVVFDSYLLGISGYIQVVEDRGTRVVKVGPVWSKLSLRSFAKAAECINLMQKCFPRTFTVHLAASLPKNTRPPPGLGDKFKHRNRDYFPLPYAQDVVGKLDFMNPVILMHGPDSYVSATNPKHNIIVSRTARLLSKATICADFLLTMCHCPTMREVISRGFVDSDIRKDAERELNIEALIIEMHQTYNSPESMKERLESMRILIGG